MAEYIDREELLKKAWDADTRIGYVQVVDVGDILDAPAADVAPVVFCKDCIHIGNGYFCEYHGAFVVPGWYCWNGERKDGDRNG